MNPFLCKYLLYYPVLFFRGQWVPKYLPSLLSSQWEGTEYFDRLRRKKLRRLTEYVTQRIPYYRDLFQGNGIGAVESLEDFQRVPLLTKELLKNNFSSLVNTELKGAHKKTTGGSTGNPVTIYQSPDSVAAIDAAYWRGYGWAGVSMCDRQVRFWGVPKGGKAKLITAAKDLILNRIRCSAFSFRDEDLFAYYHKINKFKPRYFYGYVSMLEAFAKFLAANNLKLHFDLTATISTSEVLTSAHRRLFEQTFECAVFNEYGCGEVGTIAHECEAGSLHISAENLLVEILKDGKPASAGETGDIVVTEMNNTAMPLVRYNLKDLGFLSTEPCSCGRGLPVLGGVAGRAYDTIYNRGGQAFHGEYFMYIFEELQMRGIEVSAFQVTQETYEDFRIKLVMEDNRRPELEEYIRTRVQDSYGDYAQIVFSYVDTIAREKSGKIRLIKSNLPQEHT